MIEPTLPASTAVVKTWLDALPGAVPEARSASRGKSPLVLIYKLMGRMFAILSVREEAFVIVRCDPALADLLRGQYRGIGHRSHLDPRHWISIDLDGDVPMDEAERLVSGSYALIRAGLPRKQQAELDALSS
jgi:predicted DNA-binding protein (MmcQ/YjbR family)